MGVPHSFVSKDFHLYAYLPFVELAHESIIQLGPIIFFPASKSQEFLTLEDHHSFEAYIQAMSQMKTHRLHEADFVNTNQLILQQTTCISMASTISPELRDFILIDSLYLLYFACTFRNLYYRKAVPSFNALRKLIPASLEFIKHKSNWENSYIDQMYREETACIHLVDSEICQGLGRALEAIYQDNLPPEEQAMRQYYKRMVRSIRYLVDRFFQRFINLLGTGLHFSDEIFKPEDVIFLVSSFEALFDINDKQPAADFKHKLRPLLHLKYGKPVELFWKWADDFYETRRRIVQGDVILDPLFRFNPNFEISHILIAIKLFIYSVYYTLFKNHLLQSIHEDLYTPPDFKWIHPEEILLFFWTEPNLLSKLSLFIRQIQYEPLTSEIQEELYADIHLLTHLFVSLYENYYLKPQSPEIRFIPTPLAELIIPGNQILESLKQEQLDNPKGTLLTTIHPNFFEDLKERLHAHFTH